MITYTNKNGRKQYELTWCGFRIVATAYKDRLAPFSDAHYKNWNRHEIVVYYNDKYVVYDFWTSLMEPTITEDRHLLEALRSLFSDALCGLYEYDEFCADLCYDPDEPKTRKTYSLTQEMTARAIRLLGLEDYNAESILAWYDTTLSELT